MKVKKALVFFLFLISLGYTATVEADFASFAMTGEFLFAEAEDLVAVNSASRIEDSTASGGNALCVEGISEAVGNSSAMAVIDVNTPGQYRIWLRIKSGAANLKIVYKLSESEAFTEKPVTASSAYRWINLGTRNCSADRQELYINTTEDACLDSIFITSDMSFVPAGISPAGDSNYKSGFFTLDDIPLFPKTGVHPRLYVTAENIPALKEKLSNEFFKGEYAKVLEKGNSEVNCLLPRGATDYTNYSSYNGILLSRAFLYLIGEADATHGKVTVRETKNFLGTVTFDEHNSTYASRYMGETMVMAACVYDWCYDLMTDADRQFIIRKLKGFAGVTEVGYPAVKRSYVISHGTESLIYRDQLAVGIAVYDEDPNWYNSTASIVFSKLLPAKNFLSASGNDFSGSTYTQARNEGAMHTQRMMSALGYEESIFNPDYEKLYYKFIYGRLPNGIWFKEGDDYAWDRYVPDTRSSLYGELFRYTGTRYQDPYILRQGLLDWQWSGGASNIFDIIFTDTSVGIKEVTDLPLTHFTRYPMSSMTARTSWQNGLDAPTAMVHINMREVTVGDHQHRDIGNFQFYYKGMLALDSGLYVYSDHYYNYHIRSVAHNVMLVEDPEETYGEYAPDGGQRLPRSFGSIYDDLSTVEASIAADECITARNTYTYSGPDSYRPEFSYISADIAPAYSDKIEGYRRSFVFVNLENEDYPAALVVYDNLESREAYFTKKWLLHSEEEPYTYGNTAVVTRTDNGQNGKLINKTLLPENIKIQVIGGEGNEFSVNSVNYPIEAGEGIQADMGKWRTEISPHTASSEDIFLNVMYVTDADKTLPEPIVTKGEGDSYVSATVADKTMLFPKTRDNISAAFELVIEDGIFDDYDCLITGIDAGKWTVTGKDTNIVLQSAEGEFCLSLTLAPGSYTVSPAADTAELTSLSERTSEKENLGDFLIRKNNNLMYLPAPTSLVDGVPYVAVDGIFTQLGAQISEISADVVTFTADGTTVTLTAGSNEYILDGVRATLSHIPVVKDGKIYASLSDFSSVLGISNISYNSEVKLLSFKHII